MINKDFDRAKLDMWQSRLDSASTAFAAEVDEMDARQHLYDGSDELKQIVEDDDRRHAPHVRNVIAEMIEAQVDSNIPQPKVTARRKEDERLAKLIEDMIRNELDRLPMEEYNDVTERTVKIQGGVPWLLTWDNTRRTHLTVGELDVSPLSPLEVVPQEGIYTGIDDMDYIILKIPQTKAFILRQFGVDVSDESEAEPEIKGDGDDTEADAMVTQYIAYYRNDGGGVGMYSWVNDICLVDNDDYQARRLKRCASCGEPVDESELDNVDEVGDVDGTTHDSEADRSGGDDNDGGEGENEGDGSGIDGGAEAKSKPRKGWVCPVCGGTEITDAPMDYEEINGEVMRSDGSVISPTIEEIETGEIDELGYPVTMAQVAPLKIPYYKPDAYPIILQKNISVYGQFLGESDVDRLKTVQNAINVIHTNIIDKLLLGGSYAILPSAGKLQYNAARKKRFVTDNVADASMIKSVSMDEPIDQDMAYLSELYEEAKQISGITDSYLGRKDTTANSGKAKEFSASQAAGRLESKRLMKQAAYARIFELIFKFMLAYSDEPRPVVSEDTHGSKQYEQFNRFDFLKQDSDGQWYWNDQFIFACDVAAPLSQNRESLWQEARNNFTTGAYGDPTDINTLLMFWTVMDGYHYPLASQAKAFLEERLKAQQEAQLQQQQLQQQLQEQQNAAAQGETDTANQKSQIEVIRQAKQDAATDAFRSSGSNASTKGGDNNG